VLVRRGFWTEAVLAALSGVLAFTTVVWRDWIEVVFGVDPDRHSGALEWAIVAALVVAALGFGGLARSAWHAART
jgi:hypothetical protein